MLLIVSIAYIAESLDNFVGILTATIIDPSAAISFLAYRRRDR